MSMDSNRLLLVLEKTLKDVNREIINAEFDELRIEDLKPVLEMVAHCRAAYLKDLFLIAEQCPTDLPSEEHIATLKAHRQRYEELTAAARALETAIERNYLDVFSTQTKAK